MDLVNFTGRTAIVTGGGRGLGRAAALLLASRGAQVVVNDLGVRSSVDGSGLDHDRAAGVVAEIEAAGGSAVADVNSVASIESAAAIVERARREFGHVDIIVNNAGLAGHEAPFAALAPEQFQRMLDVNVLGPAYVLQAAWPDFEARQYGRVVNMCSGSMWGNRTESAYIISKAGLWGLTRALADAGEPHGICVNAVMPLAFTDMAAGSMSQSDSPIAKEGAWMGEWLRDNSPPSLVAPLMCWLASEECAVSGEVFTAGAGRVARAAFLDTPGFVDVELTVESLRDHFVEVMEDDRWKYHSPGAHPRYRYHVDAVEAVKRSIGR